MSLQIQGLGLCQYADINFGDITLLTGDAASMVGPALQAALDGNYLSRCQWKDDRQDMASAVFGSVPWTQRTCLAWQGQPIKVNTIWKQGCDRPRLFYIPGNRWIPQHNYSHLPLYGRMWSAFIHGTMKNKMWGHAPDPLPDLPDDFWGGGTIDVLEDSPYENPRVRLLKGDIEVPLVMCPPGYREALPLIWGLEHIMSTKDYEWVWIDSPELGLSPKAQTQIMQPILNLLFRGIRVVVTTQSPTIVKTLWAVKCVTARDHKFMGKSFRGKDLKAYAFIDGVSVDISTLDVESADTVVSSWGGLLEGSLGEMVRDAVNGVGE